MTVTGLVGVFGLRFVAKLDARSNPASVEAMGRQVAWITTEQAAAEVGMTAEWIRHQINVPQAARDRLGLRRPADLPDPRRRLAEVSGALLQPH